MDDLILERFDGPSARHAANTIIVPIYEASHAADLEDPFHSTDRFLDRLDAYTRRDGFEMIAASLPTTGPIGLAFGFPLPPTTRWWHGLTTPVPDGFTDEDGTRTFGVNEIMVHPDWQRRGVARTAHHELLAQRPEQRATLLVEPDNTPARTAYERWGYRCIGTLHPFQDAPFYDAMVLDLPLTARN